MNLWSIRTISFGFIEFGTIFVIDKGMMNEKENSPSWVHTTEIQSDIDMHGNPYYYEASVSYPEEREWADFDD